MKKQYSEILRSVLFLGVLGVMLVLVSSCIKDDLSDCIDERGNVRLTLELDVNATARNSNPDGYKIDSTHVYVFDQDNRFVTFATGGVYDPAQDYEFFFTLEGGEYRFIVWTNPGDIYKTNSTFEECEENLYTPEDLIYYMDSSAGECLTQNIPDLLYGTKRQEIDGNWNNHVIVDMTPNTYNINVKVKGLTQENEEDFEFSITDNISDYNFDNTIIPLTDDYTHIRYAAREDDELNVSFKVLSLDEDRNPLFVFTDHTNSDVLFSGSIIDIIRSIYEHSEQTLDFGNTYTFDIVLTFDVDAGVMVSIGDWEYLPQPAEL